MLHPHVSPLLHISMHNQYKSPHVSLLKKVEMRVARGLHFMKDSTYALYWGQERAQAPLKLGTLSGSQGTRRDPFMPHLPA